MGTRVVKFFSKAALAEANAVAIARGVKQALAPEAIAALPDDVKIPVYQYHPLTPELYRCALTMTPGGDVALLDVPRATLRALPERRIIIYDA